MQAKRNRASSMDARYLGWGRYRSRRREEKLVRLEWVGSPPSGSEWADANLILAESFRSKFNPRNLVKLDFRAIPDTAGEYDIKSDILIEPPVRFYPIRTKPKRKQLTSAKEKKEQSKKAGKLEGAVRPSVKKLQDIDFEILTRFSRLSVERRIHFWQKHLSRFFQKA